MEVIVLAWCWVIHHFLWGLAVETGWYVLAKLGKERQYEWICIILLSWNKNGKRLIPWTLFWWKQKIRMNVIPKTENWLEDDMEWFDCLSSSGDGVHVCLPIIVILALDSDYNSVTSYGLNILAEILCFGDREFYKDWWNAKTIDEVNF